PRERLVPDLPIAVRAAGPHDARQQTAAGVARDPGIARPAVGALVAETLAREATRVPRDLVGTDDHEAALDRHGAGARPDLARIWLIAEPERGPERDTPVRAPSDLEIGLVHVGDDHLRAVGTDLRIGAIGEGGDGRGAEAGQGVRGCRPDA